LDDIGYYRLPNNFSHSLKITGFQLNETLYFSISIYKGSIKTAGIESVNWQDLKDFLKKNEFQRYEANKINPKYFNLMEQLRKELFEVHPNKINSQKRILILAKRLFIHREPLDLSELAKEFNVSHSQLVRDISIIRSIFDYKEIRYNRISHKYELI
jgi:hypothetical protein